MRAARTIAAVAVAVAGAAALHTTVGAYSTYAHWASGPVTFYVNPVNADVSQTAAIAALQTGMDVWNTQSGTPFRYQYGGTANDTATAYDNRNVILFRNTTASSASTIATTYSWWNSSNELLDADIIFWDGGFTFFTGTSGCGVVPNAAYIEDIAAHELGHALGLNHSTVADATMYPSYSYCSQALRTLSADDIAAAQSLYGSGSTPANTAPSVTISSPASGTNVANGASVTFTGSAADTQDGSLTSSLAWSSNIDGSIGLGGSFSRVLSAGTHTVTATVVDAGGLQTSKQVTVTVAAAAVTQPPPSGATLQVTGRKVKGLAKADLSWNGLSGSSIDVYRNSSKFETTSNDGAETDSINKKGSFTYTYKVCAAGTTSCSNEATVTF
jgi:hypothetical protein